MSGRVETRSGNNEWNTPPEIIEAARSVMGCIDCDPATNLSAQSYIKAKKFYTAEQSGLRYPWRGNIWMNPPYSSGLISRFVACLIQSKIDCFVDSFIVLTNNSTETKWFQKLLSHSDAVCFPKGRIRFLVAGEPKGVPMQGQTIFYMGPNIGRFYSTFSKFGLVSFMTSAIPSIVLSQNLGLYRS